MRCARFFEESASKPYRAVDGWLLPVATAGHDGRIACVKQGAMPKAPCAHLAHVRRRGAGGAELDARPLGRELRVFICNIYEDDTHEAHDQEGMRVAFTVE
jgi:hypothetical protein